MLQVGAEALIREGGPDDELMDGGGVLRPDREMVLGKCKLILEDPCVLRVFKEQDGAVGVAEAREAALGVAFKLLRRRDGFDNLGDEVPKLEVLFLDHEYETRGVRAEGRWGELEGCGEDFFDARIRDRGGRS